LQAVKVVGGRRQGSDQLYLTHSQPSAICPVPTTMPLASGRPHFDAPLVCSGT
jgi:hypothetical protein